ncbi:haloacid dehalogenase-like hydrolase domain protein [Halobacteriovorax sp. BALOs_7]|uniref:HAD family hydrolase n=1 Tax=Halobacteriovorax sp. BALOs_7 TaxID=2109558 RepID=UPI000EA26DEA|nr:HAD family hydrolase [Halobacteriovorax sp. BALOs_7]AYF43879.1 haloacid dehalogenase-like hydrolase domain protein [Halobacteriovorax sp. BALOs_7]
MKKNLKITLFSLFAIISCAAIGYFASDSQETTTTERWVFFDLGDTIVNTKESGNYHYYPGALEYIRSLKEMGIKVAIISNIPESFGETYDQKIESLNQYVKAHWNDQDQFDLTIFHKVYIPMSNDELKPAPYIFNKALDETGRHPSLYISEAFDEVEAAKQLGFAGFHFAAGVGQEKVESTLYIELSEIVDYIDQNSHL